MAKGYLHIYTGDGKGKTSAAIGLSVRARSRGLRVLFVQFFKERDSRNEISLLVRLGIETIIFENVKSPLFNPDIDRLYLKSETIKALSEVADIFLKNKFDLIILDEFVCLVSGGVLSEIEAKKFIGNKPAGLELILTGAGATEGIIELGDYVTLMKNIRHPYENNMPARKGIEF